MYVRVLAIGLLGGLGLHLSSRAEDWTHWRGSNRNGIVAEQSGFHGGKWIGDRPVWTAAVGTGSSSPLVIGDRVILLGHSGGKDHLRCLNLADGKERWSTSYASPLYGRFHVGDEGFYAGPCSTPEYDAASRMLFTLGIDGQLIAWNFADPPRIAWQHNLYQDFQVERRPKLTRAPQRDYGYTSSPMVIDDTVVVEVGSTKSGTLIGFDKKNGKVRWNSELKDEAGHTGGAARTIIDGKASLVVVTQRNLAAVRIDPGNEGKTIATFPWVTDFANSIAGPAVDGDCAIVTSAYNHNAMVKVQFSSGSAKELWRVKSPSKVCTPVIFEGKVYVAWQKIRCLDWRTGNLQWEGPTIGDPGSCVITADRKLVVYGHHGRLSLAETGGDKYAELAAKDGIFKTHAWPHVVFSNGRVICRDREGNVSCFAVGK